MLALIERDGALLLERRSDCGCSRLVGGEVDIEESLEDGLRREVREETGLAAVECSLFRVFDDPTRIVRYPDGNVVRLLTFAYEVRVEDFGALRRSEESEELRFFRREELPNLKLALAVYPEAHVVIDDKDGLLLYPSAPPVPERKMLRA